MNIPMTKSEFYQLLKVYSLAPTKKRDLNAYFSSYFFDLSFEGKRILDVGSGNGILSFYMLLCQAKSVICMEPWGDGNPTNSKKQFDLLMKKVNMKNIEHADTEFMDFKTGEKFDFILLSNSINHLDENAVVQLHKERSSRDKYLLIIKRIYNLLDNEGFVLISDCSRSNFFGTFLKIKNPFAQGIEWQKHQNVNTWKKLFEEVGFTTENIRYGGGLANKLCPIQLSKVISYFTGSSFSILFRK
jgi:SAM-dependent methyltransferase